MSNEHYHFVQGVPTGAENLKLKANIVRFREKREDRRRREGGWSTSTISGSNVTNRWRETRKGKLKVFDVP